MEDSMKQIILQIIGVSLLAAIILQPVQATTEKRLENRIKRYLSAKTAVYQKKSHK